MDRFETAKPKGDRLHQRLHAEIASGRMRPGERLSETRVAEQYAISRPPAREVLCHLLEEGLPRVVPQIGTFVAPIRLGAVRDSQFICEALKCRAVRLATKSRTRGRSPCGVTTSCCNFMPVPDWTRCYFQH